MHLFENFRLEIGHDLILLRATTNLHCQHVPRVPVRVAQIIRHHDHPDLRKSKEEPICPLKMTISSFLNACRPQSRQGAIRRSRKEIFCQRFRLWTPRAGSGFAPACLPSGLSATALRRDLSGGPYSSRAIKTLFRGSLSKNAASSAHTPLVPC